MKRLITTIICVAIFPLAILGQDISLKGKELFGGMKARNIGPALLSGRIIDLESHPTHHHILFLG